jgi:hypothetical protein
MHMSSFGYSNKGIGLKYIRILDLPYDQCRCSPIGFRVVEDWGNNCMNASYQEGGYFL